VTLNHAADLYSCLPRALERPAAPTAFQALARLAIEPALRLLYVSDAPTVSEMNARLFALALDELRSAILRAKPSAPSAADRASSLNAEELSRHRDELLNLAAPLGLLVSRRGNGWRVSTRSDAHARPIHVPINISSEFVESWWPELGRSLYADLSTLVHGNSRPLHEKGHDLHSHTAQRSRWRQSKTGGPREALQPSRASHLTISGSEVATLLCLVSDVLDDATTVWCYLTGRPAYLQRSSFRNIREYAETVGAAGVPRRPNPPATSFTFHARTAANLEQIPRPARGLLRYVS
jgi:hypothetical protein